MPSPHLPSDLSAVTPSGCGDPEPTYFSDPAIDRLMGVVMSLASEVWILNDRLSAMERLLADKGVVTEIDRDFEGDAFAPALDAGWQETARESHTSASGLPFAFVTYTRTP